MSKGFKNVVVVVIAGAVSLALGLAIAKNEESSRSQTVTKENAAIQKCMASSGVLTMEYDRADGDYHVKACLIAPQGGR